MRARFKSIFAATLLGLPLAGSANLIVNGDFELGNSGFTSDYTFRALPLDIVPPAVYTLTTDPDLNHPGAASYGDHTSGSGLMMAVNGSTAAGDVVWEQTVAVTAGSIYDFAAYISSWISGAPADLRFVVNGDVIGSLVAPLATGVWDLAFATWDAGAATSAHIQITNAQLAFGGNDFALDDIFFGAPVFSDPDALPEPATWGLLSLGLLAARRRRAV